MTTIKHEIQPEQHEALEQALTKLSIPDGYELRSISTVVQDNVDAWVFRYEKSSGENNGMGGEHYSFTITQETHKILGMIWLDQRFKQGHPLPSSDDMAPIVKAFLQKVEPGLFERSENRWIRPEDFEIKVAGETMTVTGLRYKLYMPADNKWGWVIVATGGQIMAFEQEMIWLGGRISEMWLHDDWVSNRANNKITRFVKNTIRKLR